MDSRIMYSIKNKTLPKTILRLPFAVNIGVVLGWISCARARSLNGYFFFFNLGSSLFSIFPLTPFLPQILIHKVPSLLTATPSAWSHTAVA